MPLLPSAFQDRETMALGRKIEQPKPKKECPLAEFESGEHLKDGRVVAAYHPLFALNFIPMTTFEVGQYHKRAIQPIDWFVERAAYLNDYMASKYLDETGNMG